MYLSLTIKQWEGLTRELVWMRYGTVLPQHLERPYKPQEHIAAWKIVRGGATFHFGNKTYHVKAGDWIFPGSISGRRVFQPETEVLSIRFKIKWRGGQNLFDHHDPIIPDHEARKKLDAAGFSLVEYIQDTLTPNGSHLPDAETDIPGYMRLRHLSENWFEAYITCMAESSTALLPDQMHDQRIVEAMRLMLNNLQQGIPLTEGEIAREVGLSLSHFKRLFTQEIGRTPSEWLNQKRLETVKERLAYTRLPIKRIAYELGFSSPSHFTAWFRQKTGTTPLLYRKDNGLSM